jgi:hypothetical protein
LPIVSYLVQGVGKYVPPEAVHAPDTQQNLGGVLGDESCVVGMSLLLLLVSKLAVMALSELLAGIIFVL